MRKWKKGAILKTRWYNLNTDPEKYYHAKLLLYYLWSDEDELISGSNSYEQSYIAKQHRIVSNANKFNNDCEVFDVSPDEIENNIPQSVWNLASPLISQEDAQTNRYGFITLQKLSEENINDTDIALDYNNLYTDDDPLIKIYMKAAHPKEMTFTEYCSCMRLLNSQLHVVMYNRLWCKQFITALHENKTIPGYRIFLSGPGGTSKHHVLKIIQRHISYETSNCDPDQPTVLMTAPIGSAAYQIGGSTINSTFLLYDKGKNKLSWGKRNNHASQTSTCYTFNNR